MNVIKYRLMKLKQAIRQKIDDSKTKKFTCSKCKREYEEMDVYNKDYKCPADDTHLEKKVDGGCKNPEKLNKESNKIFVSFENAIKLLDSYKIKREFFGFEPLNKPNFNLPENITVQGFKNHLADLKIQPTVKVMFRTLKSDIYKDSNCYNDETISEAKNKESDLFKFYLEKTKDRLIQRVKNIAKKQNRRKKKETHKKLLESPEYSDLYKSFWAKVYDV